MQHPYVVLSLSNILFGVSKSRILDFSACVIFICRLHNKTLSKTPPKKTRRDGRDSVLCMHIYFCVFKYLEKGIDQSVAHHTADGKRICKLLFFSIFYLEFVNFFNGGRAFQICEPQKKNEINSNCQQKGKYRILSLHKEKRELVVHWGTRFGCPTQGKDHLLRYIRTYTISAVVSWISWYRTWSSGYEGEGICWWTISYLSNFASATAIVSVSKLICFICHGGGDLIF